MSQQLIGQLADALSTEDWKQWQGKIVSEEYSLQEYVGGAPHSAVFLTEYDDPEPRPAAIKLIDANSPGAGRQLRSWEIAATLGHPHLIRIFQIGHCQIEDRTFFYVVTERADENLSQIIPQRALTETEATEMLRPIVDALRYLHAEECIHGHIKPSNIMACGDRLKLSADGLRDPGERIGEPGSYDPPENTFSPGGDVWSLGMTLVEVLTQRLPAGGRDERAFPEAPGTLPQPFLDIARNCLRRDLRYRWTIADVAKRLNPGGTVASMKPSVRLSDSRPRNLRWLVGFILFLGLAGTTFLKLGNHSWHAGTKRSQAAGKPIIKKLPEVPQAHTASSAAIKESPRSEKQNPIEAQPTSAHTRLAEALSTPADGSAQIADAGIIHQVLPNVPLKARTTIQGTVRIGIKVSVDSSGNVADAMIDSPGPSAYFANLALQAARRWKFAPSSNEAGHWTIRFDLSSSGTEASAKALTP
jgi:TonB family protein